MQYSWVIDRGWGNYYNYIHSNYHMAHRWDQNSRGNVLTPALVVAKAKSDSLQNIKNLNLWGNDL